MLRVIAMVLFGLMFLAEAGDLYGLVLTIEDPVPAAERFGITAGSEVLRSSVLLAPCPRRLSRRGLRTGRIIHPEAGTLSAKRPGVRYRIPRVRAVSGG